MNHHEACETIRTIIPGDGCPTLKDLIEAAALLGVSAGRLISLCSSAAPLIQEALIG